MIHISTFSGIGGFELASEWMGWKNYASCEINPFGQQVLKYYWPEAYHHGDIKTLTYELLNTELIQRFGANWRCGPIVLTGGFPCQPFSLAGKRKGTKDDRHLWPEMLRLIREIRPEYIVGENVGGIISWDGGVVFEQVQTDLETEGYEVQPFILPACGVNAPHRRDRVWFIAHSACYGHKLRGFGSCGQKKGKSEIIQEEWEWIRNDNRRIGKSGFTSNTTSAGRKERIEVGRWSDSEKNSTRMDIWPERLSGNEATPNSHQFNGDLSGLRTSEVSQHKETKIFAYPNPVSTRRKKLNTPDLAARSGYSSRFPVADWTNFPTQSPVRGVYDGISESMVRNIKSEVYGTISKDYDRKDLQEVWDAFQSKDVQREVGGLYKIHTEGILLQVLQLCQAPNIAQGEFSPFGEKASEGLLRTLHKYGSLGCSPRGRELEKQFREQFADSLPQLSHEIALATKEIEKEVVKFLGWHRNESIKAYGNAIVPQIALMIFKSIQEYEIQHSERRP
jgi:DNA (cytosine-5)-methyltransferase 1